MENQEIISSQIESTNGQGHSALAKILKNLNIDVLICGGIGGGARNILTSLGIEIIPGVIGSSDEAVIDYLKGELHYDPNTACNHHDDGHHACHEHDNKCCH
ncbi:MAG: NifB/NifX family molybdenum-iron cluster-binding protein [Thomasclavelia ramosa]